MALVAEAGEVVVVEEAAFAKHARQVAHRFPDPRIAGEAEQRLADLRVLIAPVEEGETGHEGRRDHDDRLGVAEGIADEQPGPVRERGRHQVEAGPERRQARHGSHGTREEGQA